jgi:hypothetical protein
MKPLFQARRQQLILACDGQTVLNTSLDHGDNSIMTEVRRSEELTVAILEKMDGQIADLQIWNTVLKSKHMQFRRLCCHSTIVFLSGRLIINLLKMYLIESLLPLTSKTNIVVPPQGSPNKKKTKEAYIYIEYSWMRFSLVEDEM